jgi:hypothetical protein
MKQAGFLGASKFESFDLVSAPIVTGQPQMLIQNI